MNEGWREMCLSEVICLQRGHDLPRSDMFYGKYPVAGSNGIIGYHNKYTTIGPGITIGRSGNIGLINYYEQNFWAHNTTLYSTKFIDSHPKFVFYLFKTIDFSILNSGSAVPSLNRNHLYKLKLLIPPIDEQIAISSVLSSLDDKIDILRRQNATLESMAEALFRQWFIVEAQDDWVDCELGNLFSISNGKSLKNEMFSDTGIYPVLGANGIIGRCNEFLFDEKLIYTGRVGSLGNVFIVNDKAWLSDNTLVFTNIKYFYFVYFILKSINFEDYNVGSTQPLIRQSDIKGIEIKLPSEIALNRFEIICDKLFYKIKLNQVQIYTLEKLRDTLLPKLMSGEIRVRCDEGS